ncbi:MAG: Imm1 family immunity protein [Actinomycetota bacterium]|nr:Imm1 family immunity protein [Actinomycetota bacterium]
MNLEVASLHLDRIPAGVDFVEAVRQLNEGGISIPWAWVLLAGELDPLVDGPTLSVGVHGRFGALVWAGEVDDFVSVDGLNADWATYHLGGLHDTPIPPKGEVPIETVYRALTEFIETRDRPTCVEWEVAASVESMYQP